MTATEARASGRSAARRGQDWQRQVAAAVRAFFPHADHCGNIGKAGGAGDITGIGDRIFECTVEPLSALAKKLRQAESDAIRSEFAEFYVVKRAAGEGPLGAYVVTRLGPLLVLLARFDRLEGLLDEAYAELEARR